MNNRNNKPLWLRLIGVFAALAMLLTGMVATANAAETDGAVKVVWGRNVGQEYGYVKEAINGVRDGDAWTPDLNSTDYAYANTLVPSGNFYGWNTKADGTGDWYFFKSTSADPQSAIVVDQAPTLPSGKLKYPEGGVLYAQWQTKKQFGKVQQTTVRKADFKDLSITTTGWGGSFRGALYISACDSPLHDLGNGAYGQSCLMRDGTVAASGDLWVANYNNWLYVGEGGNSKPFALGNGTYDDADLAKFVDAAYANPEVKYFNVYVGYINWDVAPQEIGTIELDRSEAPAPDTAAPVFSGVSDVTVEQGGTFDPLAGISAKDAVDGDVTKSITVAPSAVDTSKPGRTTLTYTVKDKAGNTATATRVVTVKAVAPDADKDLTVDTQDADLVKPSTAKPGEKLTLQLPSEYVGKQGDVYVYSTPVTLAVGATVSDQGTLEVTLPANLAAGKHRIVFKPYDATLPLVWDSFTVPASSQQNPQPTQPSTNKGNNKKPAAKKSLAATGSSVAVAGVAVLVLAVAAGAVLTVRRRS
ncbi:DUF5011 domain-containing protein [Bifidobacterium felsineum]|nr:DUF5011 domain-containing protein [Bifidobacterium felsineum]